MYKKLGQWQQERREAGPRETKNVHGVDPTTWSGGKPEPLAVPNSHADVTIELNKRRAEITDIKMQIQLSQDRYNHRRPGKSLSGSQYAVLCTRLAELRKHIGQLELAAAKHRAKQRVEGRKLFEDTQLLRVQAQRSELADTFMDMAKEMLADDVYQRVLIAAVHRHQEKLEAQDGHAAV